MSEEQTWRADPLQAAGVMRCRICYRMAPATDAEWMGDRLILATFPAFCPHLDGDPLMWGVDPYEARWTEDFDWERLRFRCLGRVKVGTPRERQCRFLAEPGSDYCTHHQPKPGGEG